MKKSVVLGLSLILMLSFGCAKKSNKIVADKFVPDSTQMVQLKQLSEKIPVLTPEADSILVSTKDFTIKTSDILALFFSSLSRQQVEVEKIPKENIEMVIFQIAKQEAERQLFYNKAMDVNGDVSDEDFQEAAEGVYKSYGGRDKFAEFLKTQKMTVEQVDKDIRKNLVIDKFISKKAGENVVISDEEVNAVLNTDKSATVRHILFLTQGKSEVEKADVLKKANEVLARAKAGEDFAALAKEFTEDPGSKETGGLYEKFPKGRMVPAFEEASFTLPIGSISDLVETRYGYHIIKIVDREKETRSFDEVKEELKELKGNNNRREVFTQLLQELKDESEFKLIFNPSTPPLP